MDSGKGQIDIFLRRCDELMRTSIIIADAKIGDLLKAITTSDLLYAFFRDITQNFDYVAAQLRYMNYMPYPGSRKHLLLLPEDTTEKLAFIFCLLVDLDAKNIDLGEFLSEYFYEDGDLNRGFRRFGAEVILPLRNLIRQMFQSGATDPRVAKARGKAAAEHLARIIRSERDRVFESKMADDKKVDGLLILNALSVAAAKADAQLLGGLLCGYGYYARAVGWKSDNIADMFAGFGKFKEQL